MIREMRVLIREDPLVVIREDPLVAPSLVAIPPQRAGGTLSS